ncbi:MAG: FlgD immunoglobulin-like domain containing protein, partial [Candidatus Marinimicrobia bacterium]|nr:FlgD immunoglobulin-like domain containing protein [Candidatus Neomarinimicrobiota bacterium]
AFAIYNILGERVYEMRQPNQAPGYYQFVWNGLNQNGLNVASGVYLYQLTAGKFTDKKKMVILK